MYYKDGTNTCPTGTNNLGWTSILGATSNSYDPPSGLTITRTYAVMIDPSGTPDCGISVWAGCRQITVVPDPFISSQPLSTQTVCVGGTPSNLSAIASGGTPSLTYQWYSNSINSVSGASPISLATSATYTPSTVSAGTTYYFCQISAGGSGCATINSSIVSVVVVPDPSISANPLSSQTLCLNGSPQVLTVSASGGTPSLSYQWYSNTVNNTSGTIISGATSSSYSPPTSSTGTIYYYCIVSASGSGCGSVNSSVVSVTINPQITISSQPLASQTLCNGGIANALVVSSSGGSGSYNYQWYSNSANSTSGGTLISGQQMPHLPLLLLQ